MQIASQISYPGVFAPPRPTTRARGMKALIVKSTVLLTFFLCMSAPEEVVMPTSRETGLDSNPLSGVLKLVLMGLGCLLIFICRRNGRRVWRAIVPFVPFMAWAGLCWVNSGFGTEALRTLASSFSGLIVAAGLCCAVDDVGGLKNTAKLMFWAVIGTTALSVVLGIVGLQAMPLMAVSAWQPELFHGVGRPWFLAGGCAIAIAWLLAAYLAKQRKSVELPIAIFTLIPALMLRRTFLISIAMMVIAASIIAARQRRGQGVSLNLARRGRLLLLSGVIVGIGITAFIVKTANLSTGNELSGREVVWPIVIEGIQDSPVFGRGPFGDVQLLKIERNMPEAGAAHNDFLAVTLCYGIPGLVLFIYAIGRVVYRVLRLAVRNYEDLTCRYAAILSLVSLLVAMLAENMFRDPRFLGLYLLFPAIYISRRKPIAPRNLSAWQSASHSFWGPK